MCGIAGFFGHRAVDPETRATMSARLARRGPDAQHEVLWSENFEPASGRAPNALLHTRLAIIDPRPDADQPMANAGGDIWISYNGEVYGWGDDARELQARGASFRTRSDTEFILNAYKEWGTGMLARLRGMFALAIVDLKAGKVFLARDRMGEKPLIYYHADGEFAFASTVRALLPYLPPDRRALSDEGIDAYLAHRYIPAPRTVLAHARRLPNGHWLEFDLKSRELREHAYWDFRQPTRTTGASPRGDWRQALDHAVQLRTVADRPVGIFLSGGIDSTALASRLSALSFRHIAAFTAAFPGSPLDEAADAARAARMLGLPHHVVDVPLSIRDDFVRIVADLDEPFADPSSFPLWYLARETTRHVKVVLSGDGGDELFAGYKRYSRHLASRWRRRYRLNGGLTGGWPAGVASSRLARLRGELAMSWEDAYSLRFSGMDPGQRRLLQPAAGPLPPVYWREAPNCGSHPLKALLAIDRANYLPEYILRKSDLTTMAHGLELRAPLVDHELFREVADLPDAQRFTRPPKEILADGCPACRELGLFTRKKRGFNPPLTQWLRQDLAERLPGLGARLAEQSNGRIDAIGADSFADAYLAGKESLAENLLQLLILDESLRQLRSP